MNRAHHRIASQHGTTKATKIHAVCVCAVAARSWRVCEKSSNSQKLLCSNVHHFRQIRHDFTCASQLSIALPRQDISETVHTAGVHRDNCCLLERRRARALLYLPTGSSSPATEMRERNQYSTVAGDREVEVEGAPLYCGGRPRGGGGGCATIGGGGYGA